MVCVILAPSRKIHGEAPVLAHVQGHGRRHGRVAHVLQNAGGQPRQDRARQDVLDVARPGFGLGAAGHDLVHHGRAVGHHHAVVGLEALGQGLEFQFGRLPEDKARGLVRLDLDLLCLDGQVLKVKDWKRADVLAARSELS